MILCLSDTMLSVGTAAVSSSLLSALRRFLCRSNSFLYTYKTVHLRNVFPVKRSKLWRHSNGQNIVTEKSYMCTCVALLRRRGKSAVRDFSENPGYLLVFRETGRYTHNRVEFRENWQTCTEIVMTTGRGATMVALKFLV